MPVNQNCNKRLVKLFIADLISQIAPIQVTFTTNYKLYKGTTHEFFGMAAVVPDAKDAQALAASDLKSAFSK